jgi:PPM family protein phosphatase
MVTIAAGAATSTGRVRKVNEDSYYVGSSVFAVADGMGGHAAGDRASQLAIAHVADVAGPVSPRPEDLLSAVRRASDAIADEAEQATEHQGMGTTLVGLCLTELAGSPHWLVFNVGDSRLYSFHDDALRQVTIDHSEVQELLESGEITAAEMSSHPMRHVITRSMGTRPRPEVDTWMLPYSPDESYLLCSDGLTAELTADEISALLVSARDPQAAADQLVAAAEAAGGRDNITVVVVTAGHDVGAAPNLEEDTIPRESVPIA